MTTITTNTQKKACGTANSAKPKTKIKKDSTSLTQDYSEWVEAFIYTTIMVLIIAHGLMRWIG